MAVIFPFCGSISGFQLLYLVVKLYSVVAKAAEFQGRNLSNTRQLFRLQCVVRGKRNVMLHCLAWKFKTWFLKSIKKAFMNDWCPAWCEWASTPGKWWTL